MTRTEAARQLGISRTRLAAIERDGATNPERDERGVPHYSESEVVRLRQVLGAASHGSRSKRAGAKKRAIARPSTKPVTVASDATRALIDKAEQLEAAARVATAEHRLAELRGVIEERDRELADLRAYRAQREALDVQVQTTLAWRSQRISAILAPHVEALRIAGFDEHAIAYAIAAAQALLTAQPDESLAGSVYPAHLAHTAIADALRIDRPAPLVMVSTVPGPTGPYVHSRPVGPGD
jgi:hypothetical protein